MYNIVFFHTYAALQLARRWRSALLTVCIAYIPRDQFPRSILVDTPDIPARMLLGVARVERLPRLACHALTWLVDRRSLRCSAARLSAVCIVSLSKFHEHYTSDLLRTSRLHHRSTRPISSWMSRGCYEETAVVEWAYSRWRRHVTGRVSVRLSWASSAWPRQPSSLRASTSHWTTTNNRPSATSCPPSATTCSLTPPRTTQVIAHFTSTSFWKCCDLVGRRLRSSVTAQVYNSICLTQFSFCTTYCWRIWTADVKDAWRRRFQLQESVGSKWVWVIFARLWLVLWFCWFSLL